MNPTEVKDLLNSLSPDKGQAEGMHGWRFDTPLPDGWDTFDMPRERLVEFIEYLTERCRRAESREVPDLKDKVKQLCRYAADIEENSHLYTDKECAEFRKLIGYDPGFRALCAPEEVKP